METTTTTTSLKHERIDEEDEDKEKQLLAEQQQREEKKEQQQQQQQQKQELEDHSFSNFYNSSSNSNSTSHSNNNNNNILSSPPTAVPNANNIGSSSNNNGITGTSLSSSIGYSNAMLSSSTSSSYSQSQQVPQGMIGNYLIMKTIGRGQFGKVKLGYHKKIPNEKVAIKIINKSKLDQETLKMVQREVRIMKLLHHPNIIRLYEVIETTRALYLIMEYAGEGEVMDFMIAHGVLTESQARTFFTQIVSAINYCHSKRAVHRDLKPENLLLDHNRQIKIIDFGLSNVFTPGSYLKTFCGSPTYASPELILRKEYNGPSVDIWSMGVVLFVLVTGYLPFDGENYVELFQKILAADYQIPSYLTQECQSLISRMLVVDPDKRATLDEIINHPWLASTRNVIIETSLITPPVSPTNEHLDSDIVAELVNIGFDKEELYNSIKQNKYNDSAAIYFLLLHKRQREQQTSTPRQLDSFYSEALSIPAPVGENSPLIKYKRNHKRSHTADTPSPKHHSTAPNPPPRVDIQSPSHTSVNSRGPTTTTTTTTSSNNSSNSSIASSPPSHSCSPSNNLILPPRHQYVQRRATASSINDKSNNYSTRDQVERHQSYLTNNNNNNNTSNNSNSNNNNSSNNNNIVNRIRSNSSSIAERQETKNRFEDEWVLFEDYSNEKSRDGKEKNNNIPLKLKQKSPVHSFISSFKNMLKRSDDKSMVIPSDKSNTTNTNAINDSNNNSNNGNDINNNNSSTQSQQQQQQQVQEPRIVRFVFGVNTTSMKDAPELMQQVLKVVDTFCIPNTQKGPYLIECETEGVRFTIEVCRLPRLSVNGLKFKRSGGSSWRYKGICKDLLSQMKLNA
ncbi:hypothetical protein CYY_003594 [Polysphondylium violaceum]|uniref:non-specific serine/threonine protein kinase n=1 Tax=Polysphondylium violaceum TaxID=133409 RepID=A0A8J4PYZ2_9MYCE|nr:hypothetical protein CYY_003594 [Polysphondylium violaceum]